MKHISSYNEMCFGLAVYVSPLVESNSRTLFIPTDEDESVSCVNLLSSVFSPFEHTSLEMLHDLFNKAETLIARTCQSMCISGGTKPFFFLLDMLCEYEKVTRTQTVSNGLQIKCLGLYQ